MKLLTFIKSIEGTEPPEGASVYLKSLWLDAKGDWENAHILIQDVDDKNAAWIHGYLHRREGDKGNASYWYSRAGKEMPSGSPEEEWKELVTVFL